jgi:hypothetical protein
MFSTNPVFARTKMAIASTNNRRNVGLAQKQRVLALFWRLSQIIDGLAAQFNFRTVINANIFGL